MGNSNFEQVRKFKVLFSQQLTTCWSQMVFQLIGLMYKTNLAPQLSSRTTAELGTGTESEKRQSELQNTFVPPRCRAGLGLFSTSQGSEHPPGLAHPVSHSSCQPGNIWTVENTSGIRMFQLPRSQPAPSSLDSIDSWLHCLGRGTTVRHSSSFSHPARQAKAMPCQDRLYGPHAEGSVTTTCFKLISAAALFAVLFNLPFTWIVPGVLQQSWPNQNFIYVEVTTEHFFPPLPNKNWLESAGPWWEGS